MVFFFKFFLDVLMLIVYCEMVFFLGGDVLMLVVSYLRIVILLFLFILLFIFLS